MPVCSLSTNMSSAGQHYQSGKESIWCMNSIAKTASRTQELQALVPHEADIDERGDCLAALVQVLAVRSGIGISKDLSRVRELPTRVP